MQFNSIQFYFKNKQWQLSQQQTQVNVHTTQQTHAKVVNWAMLCSQ